MSVGEKRIFSKAEWYLLKVIDGAPLVQIQHWTGLSMDECKELYAHYVELAKLYDQGVRYEQE
jgi:hypothetical protein